MSSSNTLNTITQIKFGKDVIETLTLGMYKDAEYIFREYIQNAADQIDVASKEGLFDAISDGEIFIDIDSQAATISIKDNATGIQAHRVPEILGNIACSEKSSDESKGFRGIGRLGGLAYCDRLIFETSYNGEDVKTVMAWDAIKLRNIIDSDDTYDAAEVISKIISFSTETEEASSHYMKVTLEGVSDSDLLNVDYVRPFLEMVAPVPFQTNFWLGSKIKEFMSKHSLHLDEYNIFLNGDKLYKSYTRSIKKKVSENSPAKTLDEHFDIDTFCINDTEGNPIALGWYGLSKFQQQIPLFNHFRGFRLRKHNIQIGASDTLNSLFKESRGNYYFIGEIHVTSPNLKPNSNRDYFNHSDLLTHFEKELKKKFDSLHKLYHIASDLNSAYNVIKKYNDAKTEHANVKKKGVIDNSSFAAAEKALDELKKKADEKKVEITKILTKCENFASNTVCTKINKSAEQDLETTQEDVAESKEIVYLTDKLAKLDKPKRKLVSRIYAVISKFLPPEMANTLINKIQEELSK